MFGADFLANVFVWGWINRVATNILITALFALGFAIYAAHQGVYLPLFVVVGLGVLVYLVIWNAFRRQRKLQTWRETPPRFRQEPFLYAQPIVPLTGLRAPTLYRWPTRHRASLR